MFTFPSILQHYVELYTCTIAIAMLEKLLSVGSFGGFINHLACHQTILLFLWVGLASLLWFGLLPLHYWGVGH
jgi:hypothetical protein